MGIPLLIILLILAVILIVLYNSLIRRKNAVANAFGAIDAMLKKRYDLLPNLVETVKQYMNYERDTLTKITEMRTKAVSANIAPDEKIQLENQIGSAMRNIMVQVENYPDLKANQNFLQLQEELSDIENKLAASRRFFNGATTEYNNAVESFPGNLIARNFGFRKEVMFDLGTDTRKQMEEPPAVKF